MGRLSGRLTLIEEGSQRHLDFLDGRVVFVSSTVPSERLASWLAAEGLLGVGTLRRLLAVSLLRRTLFTDLLITHGECPADELLGSLARLAETITSRVLAAPEVRFTLDPGYPVRQLLGLRLYVEPNLLMMQAARRSDESPPPLGTPGDLSLPIRGEAWDGFLRDLVREGVTDQDRVDGEEMAQLFDNLDEIIRTLSAWVSSGPGLVPIPPEQAARIAGRGPEGPHPDLLGAPHLVWNQMVLGCSVRSSGDPHPSTLHQLIVRATELDVWEQMVTGHHWQRPDLGDIDRLSARAARDWSRAAAAAALHLGVEADVVRLAVHLLVVPTDLVFWVLVNAPLPHRGLRAALLRRLPRRLGVRLARLADFPELVQNLFGHTVATRLGACLDIGRRAIRAGQVWPRTVPAGDDELLAGMPHDELRRAEAAARRAVEPANVDH